MKLWLLERTDHVGCDEYDGAVVAAGSEEGAREVCQFFFSDRTKGVVPHSDITVTLIGTVAREYKAKLAEDDGVVLASFNAG